MENPNLIVGLVFVIGVAVGWFLRGGKRARLEDEAPPMTPAERLAHAQALQDPTLLNLLRGGNKIAAIKRYRELTGSGLKESKDAIDGAPTLH